MGVLHAVMPPSVMKVRELELVENGKCELREVSRPPGRNKIGMVAWQDYALHSDLPHGGA